jgi:hypothetical protein
MKERFWPTIDSFESAKKTLGNAALLAVCQGSFTLIISVVAIVTGESFLGFDGWSLVDAALLFLIAWRLFRHSFAWSVIAVIYEAANVYELASSRMGNIVIGIIFLLVYVAGMRGAHFLRSLTVGSEQLGEGTRGTAFLRGKKSSNGLLSYVVVVILAVAFSMIVYRSVRPDESPAPSTNPRGGTALLGTK